MKLPPAVVVGRIVVLFAFWMGQAEARQRGGKGDAAPAHPPKCSAGKAHPSPPKAKPPQKANGGAAKPVQKKQQGPESAKVKVDEEK